MARRIDQRGFETVHALSSRTGEHYRGKCRVANGEIEFIDVAWKVDGLGHDRVAEHQRGRRSLRSPIDAVEKDTVRSPVAVGSSVLPLYSDGVDSGVRHCKAAR